MINKNFGTESTMHQVQKFGPLASKINKIFYHEKANPVINEKKQMLMEKIK